MTKKKLVHFAVEIVALILFTFAWQAVEEYVEHGFEHVLMAVILQRIAMNYVHSTAHHLTSHGILLFWKKLF